VVVGLGKAEAGKKLLAEAAGMAEKLGTERMQGYARGEVARHLALHDLPRARGLLQPFTGPSPWNHYTARLAVQLAPHDPAAAVALLKESRPDNSFIRDETRVRIAAALAAKDPAAAVKQAEAVEEVRYRVVALAKVAPLVARRDPALAHSLVDRALETCLSNAEAFSSWSGLGGRTTVAAWAAYQARKAGHPDLASVVARVLAVRPTLADAYSPDNVSETLLVTAALLSFTDPAAARQVARQAVPPERPVKPELEARRDTLFALALADPERAVALIDRLVDGALKPNAGLQRTGLIEAVQIVTASGERRIRTLQSYTHRFDDDDDD
jgi:hypothetical protein